MFKSYCSKPEKKVNKTKSFYEVSIINLYSSGRTESKIFDTEEEASDFRSNMMSNVSHNRENFFARLCYGYAKAFNTNFIVPIELSILASFLLAFISSVVILGVMAIVYIIILTLFVIIFKSFANTPQE